MPTCVGHVGFFSHLLLKATPRLKTSAKTLLTLQTTCVRGGNLASNLEKTNKPAPNCGSRRHFAIEANENKIIIKAIAFQSFFHTQFPQTPSALWGGQRREPSPAARVSGEPCHGAQWSWSREISRWPESYKLTRATAYYVTTATNEVIFWCKQQSNLRLLFSHQYHFAYLWLVHQVLKSSLFSLDRARFMFICTPHFFFFV